MTQHRMPFRHSSRSGRPAAFARGSRCSDCSIEAREQSKWRDAWQTTFWLAGHGIWPCTYSMCVLRCSVRHWSCMFCARTAYGRGNKPRRLRAYLSTCLHAFMHACSHACLHTCLLIYIPASLPTYIRTYLSTHLHALLVRVFVYSQLHCMRYVH
jgi:hypothetical protein